MSLTSEYTLMNWAMGYIVLTYCLFIFNTVLHICPDSGFKCLQACCVCFEIYFFFQLRAANGPVVKNIFCFPTKFVIIKVSLAVSFFPNLPIHFVQTAYCALHFNSKWPIQVLKLHWSALYFLIIDSLSSRLLLYMLFLWVHFEVRPHQCA